VAVCQFIPVLCVLGAPYGVGATVMYFNVKKNSVLMYIYCALVGAIKHPNSIQDKRFFCH
jgi:hypothetical protein